MWMHWRSPMPGFERFDRFFGVTDSRAASSAPDDPASFSSGLSAGETGLRIERTDVNSPFGMAFQPLPKHLYSDGSAPPLGQCEQFSKGSSCKGLHLNWSVKGGV